MATNKFFYIVAHSDYILQKLNEIKNFYQRVDGKIKRVTETKEQNRKSYSYKKSCPDIVQRDKQRDPGNQAEQA